MWVNPAQVTRPGSAQGKRWPTSAHKGWADLGPEMLGRYRPRIFFSLFGWAGPDLNIWAGTSLAHPKC